jgi:hypothetical protein
MGRIRYNYFKFTIVSMKYNPTVTYVIVNLVPDLVDDYWREFEQLVIDMDCMDASNVI